ncbi:hypothetical protein PWG71_08570 [Nocardiopsis sp. N85]|uniref:hypothetical protein n=1 Tax=Nocardiopsis sp. N85 TaxID=3029400 RepID=UPI00237FACCD|nr:hypothetical protein [Nocardiopsis sp. N85]MDE3721441.1 hypothetical protein [Nocardiopsis sp. N85]
MLTRVASWNLVFCTATAAVIVVLPQQAAADGFFADSVCSDGGCHVTARTPGRDPAVADSPAGRGGAGEGGQSGLACVMPDTEFAQSGAEGPLEAPPSMARCESTGGTVRVPVFDPVVLAEQARAVMRLPEPDIGVTPTPDKLRFVNIPQWMWVAETDWAPVSATASVSAGSVTVLATPQRVVWDTGDGHEVVCTGPGTVFSRMTYRQTGSPDCGHTYTALPSGGAGARVDLVAVWEWEVSWSASDGRSGDLEALTTTAMVAVPVSEIHAVVTDNR